MVRRYGGELIYRSHGEHGPIEVVEDHLCRSLHFGNATRQSTMFLLEPSVLVLDYTRAMLAALLFCPTPARALLLGLGGGSLPKFLLRHLPELALDAVELRADVIQVAQTLFELPLGPRLRVHQGDAQAFLRDHAGAPYDLVLVDVYIPTGMARMVRERDFFAALQGACAPGGVVSINLSRNEPADHRASLRLLREGFARRVLRLPVPGKGNDIALALAPGWEPRAAPGTLQQRAADLQERTGVEFTGFLNILRRDSHQALRHLLD